jgi:hypothetical protein
VLFVPSPDHFSGRVSILAGTVRDKDGGSGRAPPRIPEETDMTQYLLSVHMVDGQPTPPEEEMRQMFKAVDAVNDELRSTGAWVFAGGLHPPSTATVVRAQGGQVVTTDGPFAETKEQLGGFWVINAADLDAALEWAAKASAACRGPVEVRPFQDVPEG